MLFLIRLSGLFLVVLGWFTRFYQLVCWVLLCELTICLLLVWTSILVLILRLQQ